MKVEVDIPEGKHCFPDSNKDGCDSIIFRAGSYPMWCIFFNEDTYYCRYPGRGSDIRGFGEKHSGCPSLKKVT